MLGCAPGTTKRNLIVEMLQKVTVTKNLHSQASLGYRWALIDQVVFLQSSVFPLKGNAKINQIKLLSLKKMKYYG